jgi:ABC-type glycerol-3-phosphate transport system permease component
MTRKAQFWKSFWLTALITVAALVTIFPIYWMAQMSIKPEIDSLKLPPALIFKPVFTAYGAAWGKLGFTSALINSIIVSALATLISISLGLLAAYAFSRYRFRGDQAVFFGILMTRVFPPIAMIIPFYLNLRLIGGQDTYWGLALAYIAMNTPLAIWMLKGYFDGIPVDLEHCAMIDGATRFQAATKVTLPLIAPGVAATSIFTFITSWNEFLFALILTTVASKSL